MVFNLGAVTFPVKSNALKFNGPLRILQNVMCYFKLVTFSVLLTGHYFLPTYVGIQPITNFLPILFLRDKSYHTYSLKVSAKIRFAKHSEEILTIRISTFKALFNDS